MKSNFALILVGGLAVLTACSPSAKLTKKADTKFKEQAAYNEAADLYKQALEKGGDPKYLNAMIAESYRLSNRPAMAAPYYKAALDSKNNADSLKFYYAQSLKAAGQDDAAKTAFETYAKNGRRQRWKDRAKMEEANIGKIATLPNKTDDYEITNLESINTTAGEYSPIISPTEDLVYTGSRGGKIYAQTGTPFTDIYSVKIADMGNAAIQPAPVAKVNTDDRHEASASYSKDGKLMVFARSNDGSRKGPTDVDLYQSKLGPDGNWSDPEVVSVSSLTAWDATPALSPDGKTLYFSSNREGGKGGNDLYRSTLDPATGRWGKPTNLGESINTAGDEMFPYVTEDGKLYFSSDGQPGFGGLDVFVATRNKEEGTKVENLGMPINSKADDFGIAYKNAYEGYLSSNREGGKGDDDIYYFKNLIAEPKIVRYNVKGTITGHNNGADEGALAGSHVKIMDAAGQPVAEATTDAQGNFNFMAEEDKNFSFLIEHEGYFAKRDNFSTSGKRPPLRELRQKENTVDLTYASSLDKIKLEQTIVIENIYYDYDKSDIRPDAALELDKVVTMLNDNPAISIELSSHTDSRGDDNYNKVLSQARAESAVAYIVSKGVNKDRIYAKGYGEGKPIVPNAATDEEYQKNRRTEFKVTKIAHTHTADEVTPGMKLTKPAKKAPAKKGAAKKPAPKK